MPCHLRHMTPSSCRQWLAAVCFATLAVPAYGAPDVIVINADVYTVNADRPRVESFAVENGRFTALGANEEIRGLADADTRIIDADGNTVTPGFIDAHQHFSGTSNQLNL